MRGLPPSFALKIRMINAWPDADFTPTKVKVALIAEARTVRFAEEMGFTEASGSGGDVLATQKKVAAKSPKKPPRRPAEPGGICFRCGEQGHWQRDCPKRPLEQTDTTGRPLARSPVAQAAQPPGTKFSRRRRGRGKSPGTKDQSRQALYAALTAASTTTNDWNWDSGASDHVCCDRRWFTDLAPCTPQILSGITGSVRIDERGTVAFTVAGDRYTVGNVGYAPGTSRNLISASQSARQAGTTWTGDAKRLQMYDAQGREGLAFQCRDRLFVVKASPVTDSPDCTDKTTVNAAATQQTKTGPSPGVSKAGSLRLWHQRLAHTGQDMVKRMSQGDAVRGMAPIREPKAPCAVCEECKANRPSTKTYDKISTKAPLELIHADVWGPSPVASRSGMKYYLVLVDDFTRWSTAYPLRSKDQVLDQVKVYVQRMERQTGRTVKKILTDNGGEFCSRASEAYYQEKGIVHVTTNVHSPHQNGIAERFNQTALKAVRVMRKDSAMPKFLWAELLLTFVYLKNRVPQKILGYKTPFERLRGHPPNLGHLRRIGSKVYGFLPKGLRKDKLEDTAESGTLIGYSSSTRGYRYIDKSGRVHDSAQVRVDETDIAGDRKREVEETGHHLLCDASPKSDSGSESGSAGGRDVTLSPKPGPSGVQTPPRPGKGGIPSPPKPKRLTPTERYVQATVQVPLWRRILVPRKTGTRVDVYYDHAGTRFKTLKEVWKYCEEANLPFSEDFDFSPKDPTEGVVKIRPQTDPKPISEKTSPDRRKKTLVFTPTSPDLYVRHRADSADDDETQDWGPGGT